MYLVQLQLSFTVSIQYKSSNFKLSFETQGNPLIIIFWKKIQNADYIPATLSGTKYMLAFKEMDVIIVRQCRMR